ncbi:integrase [Streptomyces sp. YPW6]|uniref:integrase n=1 Tax=Streptomyces sp. YPW6 TaxID=2840373 RepID=UPI003EBE7804
MSSRAVAYDLRPPARDAWLFDPDGVAEHRRQFVPRYGDPSWSLLALSKNPSQADDIIHWNWFSDTYCETFRHAAWALVNHPLPDVHIAKHGAPMRARLSAGRLLKCVNQWSVFAEWLEKQGITTLAAVTVEDLTEFAHHLGKIKARSRNTVCSYLLALSRLHYYGEMHLPPADRLMEPPWIREGQDDYLPAASSKGENVAEPITPATMGPLLVWALRFVELFAPDILAAHVERRELHAAADALDVPITLGCDAGLQTYLASLEAKGAPVPVADWNPRTPFAPAALFLSAKTGTPVKKIHQVMRKPHWRAYTRDHHEPAMLDTPVTAMLGGQPWHEPFEFYRSSTLVKHLATACFIVVSYLTGMRTGEVLALQTGCCPDPGTDEAAAKRHLIYGPAIEAEEDDEEPHSMLHGRQFKRARDEDGNHDSAGSVRAPWVAVPQVVNAVRVLEALGPGGGLLFAAEVHDPRLPDRRSSRSLAYATMANRMNSFIEWVNAYAETRGRSSEMIPPDPHGSVGTGRFRRTLAWHIARRPGGLVALAVQYGHMRTLISEGYAARSRGGIRDLLDFETARTVAETLTDMHDAMQEGEGVSGPAARRLIHAAATEHQRFGGMIATTRQARSLLADPTLNVFENKEAFLLCNYDREKALCHPSRGGAGEAPSLDRCRSACANIARTDHHADQMLAAAENLRMQALSPLVPEPMAERLRSKAEHLEELAAQHRAARITLEDGCDE